MIVGDGCYLPGRQGERSGPRLLGAARARGAQLVGLGWCRSQLEKRTTLLTCGYTHLRAIMPGWEPWALVIDGDETLGHGAGLRAQLEPGADSARLPLVRAPDGHVWSAARLIRLTPGLAYRPNHYTLADADGRTIDLGLAERGPVLPGEPVIYHRRHRREPERRAGNRDARARDESLE